MTVNPLSNVNPNQWASILEGAVQSREKTFGHHFYIIKEGDAITANTLKKGGVQEKLSIKEIIDISKSQFNSLNESYKKGDINREGFNSLSGKISHLTEQLIDARIAKRNQPLKVFGRQIAYAISAFASIFGISAFKSLKESDKAFQEEVKASKASLAQAKEVAESLVLLEDRRTNIEQLTQEIPGIIGQALSIASKEEIEQILTKKIIADVKGTEDYSKGTPYTIQFKKDIERDFQFMRKDVAQEINDQSPHPNIQPGENDNSEDVLARRVSKGVEEIKALIIHEDDKRWEKIIQSACTQSTLITIFDAPILLFTLSSVQHQWEEEGVAFKATLRLPEQYPPIQLEIIRDPDSQAIQKVNVVVEGGVNIVRESINYVGDGIVTSIEAANVMKGSFHFSITLDENNAPVIEATQYELTQ